MSGEDGPPLVLDYAPPKWGKVPEEEYKLEVLKDGCIVEERMLKPKSFITVGRHPDCDLSMAHGSVSRVHSIIQFGKGQAFIYDLSSTHGTFLNKARIAPKTFIPLPSDCLLRFGASTRSYILSSAEAALELPWEKNPVHYLTEWLDANGMDFDVATETEDQSSRASIRLSADALDISEDIVMSATGPSKKAATAKLAAEVCQRLCELGLIVLNQPSKRRRADEEEDGGDDLFFDRTKKQQAGSKGSIETFDSLLLQKAELELRLAELEKLLAHGDAGDEQKEEEEDELEAYLSQISNQQAATDMKKYSAEAAEVKTTLTRILSLIAIAKPHDYTDPISVIVKKQSPPRITKVIDEKAPVNRIPVREEETPNKPKEEKQKKLKLELEEEVEEWLPPDDTTQTDLKSQYGY